MNLILIPIYWQFWPGNSNFDYVGFITFSPSSAERLQLQRNVSLLRVEISGGMCFVSVTQCISVFFCGCIECRLLQSMILASVRLCHVASRGFGMKMRLNGSRSCLGTQGTLSYTRVSISLVIWCGFCQLTNLLACCVCGRLSTSSGPLRRTFKRLTC